ncbi:MAG TPA: energy transducer TonB [Candidatus Barnesiella excrementipullorum]|jgi:protein TonB|uniref:Energy transducer TonB n=1 Tax=Candidatus Barnesiella excrementipullorum TaxID=2838479 RepID=A0A9D1VQA2_9BACT|nr:energy transducer TonB [Candidatus Barnesiella excrementipullorum]
MASIDLNSSKWCELAFEGKNKKFGGYVIRQEIGKRHLIAIVASIVALALAFIIPALIDKIPKEKDAAIDFTVTEVEMANLEDQEIEKNEDIQPIVEAPPPPPLKSSIKFTAPVITADENVKEEEEIRTQDEMAQSNINISIADVEGVDTEDAQDIADFREVIAEPEPEVEKVYDAVEQMPQFPGGDAELMKYIYDNLRYPAVAQENGIQGQVLLRFVVSRTGAIENIQVLRSPDPSLAKEAVRVLQGMPKWIPGKQNGNEVPVYFTLPVKFKLM